MKFIVLNLIAMAGVAFGLPPQGQVSSFPAAVSSPLCSCPCPCEDPTSQLQCVKPCECSEPVALLPTQVLYQYVTETAPLYPPQTQVLVQPPVTTVYTQAPPLGKVRLPVRVRVPANNNNNLGLAALFTLLRGKGSSGGSTGGSTGGGKGAYVVKRG